MSYKCRICGVNDVDNKGDVCELCAIGQDPYTQNVTNNQASFNTSHDHTLYNDSPSKSNSYTPKRGSNRKVLLNGGNSLVNQDPYGNDMTESNTNQTVRVYSAGQAPQETAQNTTTLSSPKVSKSFNNQPLTTGITKNITVDNQKKSIISKWFRALFSGIPFTLDDEVTMFQVFPDYSGTSLNALGNACDQVIVYGKLNNGAICDNNDVEVFGRRDSNNNIIARTIKNKASGTTVTPIRSIGSGVVWVITAILIALIVATVSGLGITGIIGVAIIILCLTNLPLVFKVFGVIFGAVFLLLKKLFK